jgi:hypothetical protein
LLRRLPFHPLFFALYPVLALLAANTGQALPLDGLRALLASLLLGGGLFLLAWLLLRRIDLAAVLASFTVLLVLSYGRLYDGLKDLGLSANLVRHRFLVPVVLLLPPILFLVLRRFKPSGMTTYLNVVAVTACFLPLAGMLASGGRQIASAQGPSADDCSLPPAAARPLPDVYLIIMDAYERDDVLEELHGYDNSGFLEALEGMGFYVARGSLSNYRHTELSLASLLNMDYIQAFPNAREGDRYNQWSIVQGIKDNRVRRELECLGYTTVAVETGAFWTEWEDADYFLRRRAGPLGALGLLGGASRLEAEFLKTTLLRVYQDGALSLAKGETDVLSPASETRALILFELEQLARIPDLPSPKLVFVHILSPHPPFVFGASGEPTDVGEFDTGRGDDLTEAAQLDAYADQVTFLNARLLETMPAILRESRQEPIIIIQGDHGWADRNEEDKLSILNAYYFPGDGRSLLYPTITPVNSFRLIFDTYFGGSLGALEDVSYFSTGTEEYDFVEVPNTWVEE